MFFKRQSTEDLQTRYKSQLSNTLSLSSGKAQHPASRLLQPALFQVLLTTPGATSRFAKGPLLLQAGP